MIKAVIFDCFGVLTASTHKLFFDTYFQNQPEKVEQVKALDHATSNGSITLEDFNRGLAEIAAIPVEEVVAFVSQHVPNTELLDYIRDELKPRYKIGFLSNVGDDLMDVLFTPDQQALFDDIVLSFQVAMAKPQQEIYELSAENLGVDITECVFVDDVQRYIDGAELAGMETVLFKSNAQFKQDIAKLLQ